MLVRLGLKHILSRFRPPVVEGVVTKPAGVFTVQNDQVYFVIYPLPLLCALGSSLG